jgi:multidrug resistance efflux pump
MFRNLSKYVLPLLGVALLGVAVLHVARAQAPLPGLAPPVEPARRPFAETVVGTGIAEAQTENIAIGTALSGLVVEVDVRVGQKATAGAPLFRLDDRQLRAELAVRQAALASAAAANDRVASEPRKEDVEASAARLQEARAKLADRADQLRRGRAMTGGYAISRQELVGLEQAVEAARAQAECAEAEHRRVVAGAWEPDRVVARAAVDEARARLRQTETELDRLVVRAPVDGEVLQVNVRPGEFVAGQPGQALVLLGNLGRLHVRVQIDEHDIPRFRQGAPARAELRGYPGQGRPLTFVRVEPYVTPKKSLTNDDTERVDTRVLQIIYALEPGAAGLYVGQQLDVFIDVGAP